MHQLDMFAYTTQRPVRTLPPPPQGLMKALTETLTQGGSIVYDAADERHARTLASGLNAIGRRADTPFTIRTKRDGKMLYAWAEERRETRPRRARGKAPVARADDGRP